MSYGVGLRNGVAFALGTIPSLTSGGGLRPSLLLDFLSGSLDPRITFSRGTQAMQYGSDGTLQYAPNNLLTYSNQADNAAWTKSNSFVQTNLLTYSQEFDNAAWVKSALNTTGTPVWINAAVAPDGTATADLLIPTALSTAHSVNTVGGTVPSGTNTFSVYAKAGGYNYLQMLWGAGTDYANFNLTGDGSVSQNSGASPTITAVPGYPGWYRCTITSTFGASTNLWLMPIITGTETRYPTLTGDGVSGVYTWGAQLVQGSVPGDYQATTSAALPCLYADYNGALRARKLCEDATAAVHSFSSSTVSLAASTSYTLSCYVKAGERNWLRLLPSNATAWGGTSQNAYFNISTGTVGTVSGGGTATITSIGNGWYRCSLSTIPTTTTGTVSQQVNIVQADNGGSYTGDGSSGIYIADAQLTPGYLPLAVTETTSAAVYGPRFDYDPSSLVTQNLLTYSEQFDNAVWSKLAAGTGVAPVVTPNYAAAPNGTITADRIVFDRGAGTTSSDISYINQTVTSISVDCTGSIWLRTTDGSTKSITFRTGNTFNYTVNVTGTWTQYTLTGTAPITRLDLLAYGDRTVQVVDLLVWGAQLNRGSTALPYTATTTAPYTLTTARGLLIEEQRTNLATFSNTFSDASWTVALGTKNVAASAVLSPEGVTNAWTLTDSSAIAFDGIQKSVAVAADGTTYTGSIYILKTSGGTSSTFGINFQITGGTTVINQPRINTDTGAVLAGTATVINAGLWWRVTCSVTNNSSVGNTTLAMQLYPATAAYNSATDTATATGSATIYGAQIETGAFATSYIPTVGSTATRNADSASITTLTPWFNAAAGTVYSQIDTNASAAPKLFSRLGPTISGSIGPYATSTNVILDKNGTGSLILSAGTLVVSNTKTAWAYDGTNVALSVNGGAVATAAGALGTPADALYIGRDSSAVTNLLNGHIQSLRYYPTRLPNASLQSITV